MKGMVDKYRDTLFKSKSRRWICRNGADFELGFERERVKNTERKGWNGRENGGQSSRKNGQNGIPTRKHLFVFPMVSEP